jgi:hypothetical protein
MKLRTVLFSSCVAFAVGSFGCSAGEAEEADLDPGESAEDALTASQLPGVAAISFETTAPRPGDWTRADVTAGPTLAAKVKVGKIMRALKTRRPSDPIPLCHPRSARTRIKFFDAKGEEIASGGYSCMVGSVTTKAGRTVQVLARTGAIADVLAMPLVPADVLFGTDEIKITRRGAKAKTADVKSDDAVAKVLGAMDLQEIDPSFTGTRCLPSHSLAFARAGKEVAYASYICSSAELPSKVTARFSAPDPKGEGDALLSGGVELDPRVVEQVLDAAR